MEDHVRAIHNDVRVHVLNPFMQKQRLEFIYTLEGVDLDRVVIINNGSGLIGNMLNIVSLLVRALRVAWAAGRFDIIHTHGAVIPGIIGVALSMVRRTPLIITEHTGPYSRISSRPIIRFIAGISLRKAKCTIAVSEYLRKEIATAHGKHPRIEVLHNPVDTSSFLPLSIAREKIILFVGRLDREKGLEKLLHAFMNIGAKERGWKINIVGEGPYGTELRSMLHGSFSALQEAVILSGPKTKQELPLIMNASAFLVHLSSHESFGITIVEALACGIPVLAGRNSAMVETVQDSCGILVDTEVDVEVQAGMERMIATWQDYDRGMLHAYAEQKYGYESFRRSMLRIYGEAVN